MGNVSKVREKVEVKLRWDPSPFGQPPRHLDIIAATYSSNDPYGRPVYVVHYDSRSPDGTISMIRDSRTGLGFGFVEVMVLELDRMAPSFGRVVVGVAIHQDGGTRTFGDIAHAGVVVVEKYTELLTNDFTQVAGSNAATVAEFTRDDRSGEWEFHEMIRGFDGTPAAFTAHMGSAPQT
ncbi:TerD-family protein [Streptomyces violascens]|uniref:TerD-family protein n=2 Tax=Streptomyces violascens TaxID=67381 RepID=A0ABQ3QXQ2_9ACTN|nr:TerD-family protein [Streptomyces violascens]GHI42033.1 TerD-family protein [Streptomyces violascens]